MNERLKQLAEQAKLDNSCYVAGHGFLVNDNGMAKFAELIVNECAEQIVAKGTDWVDFAPSQTGVRPEYWAMAQQIKQHFGVEE